MGVDRRMLLLAVVCGIAVSSIYVAQPMLGPMGRELGVDPGASGWFIGVGQLGYVVGLVFLVPLGDVLDRRRLIVTQLTLAGVALLVISAATDKWVAFVGLAAAGLFAVVVQTAVAYAAAVSPRSEQGRNIGVVTSGVVIGILGGRVLAGALAQRWGWHSTYLVLGVLALAVAVTASAMLPVDAREDRQQTSGQVLRSFGVLARHRVFWSRGMIAFFMFASFDTLWSGMSLPLRSSPWNLTEAQIGLFGLIGLAGALGAARAGAWADGGHVHRVTGIALALLLGSWLLTAQLSWSLWLLVAGVVVLDFAVEATHVSNQHVLTATFPQRTSAAIGGYMIFYSVGSALGATASTALFAAVGWSAPSILGAAFAVGALAVWGIDRARTVTEARRLGQENVGIR